MAEYPLYVYDFPIMKRFFVSGNEDNPSRENDFDEFIIPGCILDHCEALGAEVKKLLLEGTFPKGGYKWAMHLDPLKKYDDEENWRNFSVYNENLDLVGGKMERHAWGSTPLGMLFVSFCKIPEHR